MLHGANRWPAQNFKPLVAQSPRTILRVVQVKKFVCWFAFGLVSVALPMPSPLPSAAADPPVVKAPANTRSVAKETGGKDASGQEVTEQEAKEWAAALERAMNAHAVDRVSRLVDWRAFIEAAMPPASAPPEGQRLLSDFQIRFQETGGTARRTMSDLDGPDGFRALRIHRQDGHQRALFRVLSSKNGVNYHDYILRRSVGGDVVATDYYVISLGEFMSQFLRRSVLLPMLRHLGAASSLGLSPAERDYVAHFEEIGKITKDLNNAKWQAVLTACKRLPASVRASKFVLLIRLQASAASDEAEYLATIDEFRKQYPNDPTLDFISIDGYTVRKQFDKADECMQRVDRAVGCDPYLGVLRANMLVAQRKLEAARDLLQKAVAEEPTLMSAYYALVDNSLARHDFDDTLKWLTAIEAQGLRIKDLTKGRLFADFVKSPQYQTWVKSHSHNDRPTSSATFKGDGR
jgi:hypothetical protein